MVGLVSPYIGWRLSGSWKERGSGWAFLLLRRRKKRPKTSAARASTTIGTATPSPIFKAKFFEWEEEGDDEAAATTALVLELNRVLDDPSEVTTDVMTRTLTLLEVVELMEELADDEVSRVMDLSIGVGIEIEDEDVVDELADVVAAAKEVEVKEEEVEEEEADAEELAAAPEPPAMKGNWAR